MERIGILKKLKEDLEKEEKMSMNPMYNMELHELLNTPNGDFIIRVPGGWIYTKIGRASCRERV